MAMKGPASAGLFYGWNMGWRGQLRRDRPGGEVETIWRQATSLTSASSANDQLSPSDDSTATSGFWLLQTLSDSLGH